MPIEIPGLALYVLVMAAALLHMAGTWPRISEFVWVAGGASIGAAAVWLILLQAIVIRRFCVVCMVLHGVGIVVCLATVAHVSGTAHGAALVGVACTTVFALIQWAFPPKGFLAIPLQKTNVDRSAPLKPDSGAVQFGDGRIALDIQMWPVLGSEVPSMTIGFLFDITCVNCRHMYRLIEQALREESRKLRVIMLPVPLHPACNPVIQKPALEAEHACEHARLLLGTFRVSPEGQRQFTRWLMSAPVAPTIIEARRQAQKIVGDLSLALMHSSIDERLRQAADIYRNSPSDKLPQLLLPTKIIVGHVATAEELLTTIESN